MKLSGLVIAIAVAALLLAGSAQTVHAVLARQTRPVVASVTVRNVAPSGLCGDLNDDRAQNVVDVIIVLQIIVGSRQTDERQLYFADLNRDGKLNILDVIVSLRNIVGANASAECGPITPISKQLIRASLTIDG